MTWIDKLPDYRALDVERAIATLQASALLAVAQALGLSQQPSPSLAFLFERRTAENGPGAQAARRFTDAFLFAETPNWTELGRSLAAAAAPPERRRQRTRAELVDLSGTAPPGGDAFAEALIRQAFVAPQLQRNIARIIREDLAQRVVFWPEPEPVAVLSPIGLLATVAGFAERSGTGLRLCDLASEVAQRPGWAGFWDLWLLARAQEVEGFQPVPGASSLPSALAPAPDDARLCNAENLMVPVYCQALDKGLV